MEQERKLDFEVNNSVDLNKMLTGLLMDVRRGEVDHDTAKSITLVADKINKNNVNAIEYLKLTDKDNEKEIEFFEKEVNPH